MKSTTVQFGGNLDKILSRKQIYPDSENSFFQEDSKIKLRKMGEPKAKFDWIRTRMILVTESSSSFINHYTKAILAKSQFIHPTTHLEQVVINRKKTFDDHIKLAVCQLNDTPSSLGKIYPRDAPFLSVPKIFSIKNRC